jgi:oligopeptide transport system permease protein
MSTDYSPHPADGAASDTSPNFAQLLDEAKRLRGVSLGRDAWRRLRRNRMAFGSLVFLIVLALGSATTPLLPLQAPRRTEMQRIFQSPKLSPLFAETADWIDDDRNVDVTNLKNGFGELNFVDRQLAQLRAKIFGRWECTSWCGTDDLGRDVMARLFWGSRVSIIVGLVAGLVSLVIGVSYGAISGYLGGWVDAAMMRFVDVLYAVPFIFVVIMLLTVIDSEQWKAKLEKNGIDRMTVFFLVVGAIYWLTMARVVRGQVLSLKQEQFVEAARTIGCGKARIIFLHLVPNLLSVIIVYLTLTIPRVMLFEAFLSFLGLGVQAPDVSWGVLASQGTKSITPIQFDWWVIVFPGAALATTLFALNFLGDGLRDALDPRLKNR